MRSYFSRMVIQVRKVVVHREHRGRQVGGNYLLFFLVRGRVDVHPRLSGA